MPIPRLSLILVSLLMTPGLAATARAAPESGETFRTRGVTIYYEVRGAGPGLPLFVVNGGPGFDHTYVHCSAAWDTLALHRAVVFYDQRGVGRSGALKPGQSCALADQIEDLDALREHLGFSRVDLLGHSWGGYLVMAYAARHPERIAHLIIVDSAAPKWSDTVFLFKDVYPEGVARQEAVAFAEELGDAVALRSDLHEYLSMLFYSPEKRDAFLAKADSYQYNRTVNETLNKDLARYDLNPELPKLRMPTLVITGRFDMNVAPAVAWKIHQAIQGSEFAVFEKSGHLPFFEEPEGFVGRVETFLAGR
ncbi:MAG TPA: alpha/beta fold hydrolase [Candidatus Saccharimonadales bacterium]|nr:alpha/beta fold hydrolase [Candidatus Saccharimonadales bacterium]